MPEPRGSVIYQQDSFEHKHRKPLTKLHGSSVITFQPTGTRKDVSEADADADGMVAVLAMARKY